MVGFLIVRNPNSLVKCRQIVQVPRKASACDLVESVRGQPIVRFNAIHASRKPCGFKCYAHVSRGKQFLQ